MHERKHILIRKAFFLVAHSQELRKTSLFSLFALHFSTYRSMRPSFTIQYSKGFLVFCVVHSIVYTINLNIRIQAARNTNCIRRLYHSENCIGMLRNTFSNTLLSCIHTDDTKESKIKTQLQEYFNLLLCLFLPYTVQYYY